MNNEEIEQSLRLGMESHRAGRLPDAQRYYQQILHARPEHIAALHLYGVVIFQTGSPVEAIAYLEKAVAASPHTGPFYPALIDAYRDNDQEALAIHWLQKLIDIHPRTADARSQIAKTFFEQNRFPDAQYAMRSALELNPANPAPLYNNLGAILEKLGKLSDAIAAFQQSITLNPDDPAPHRNLGLLYLAQLKFRAAIAEFQSILQLDAQNVDALANQSFCHARLAEHEQAIALARRAMELKPGDSELHSTLISLLNYTHGADGAVVLDESKRWFELHGEQPLRDTLLDRGSEGPLRIGYISPDFRQHPVATFLEPVLKEHDRARFEIFCYADVPREDEITLRLKQQAHTWRNISGQSHDAVVKLIRQDEIHILIELGGHLLDNRLPVLSKKPATIQASWLGYLNTTGVEAIDYKITDRISDPAGADSLYTEKLIRLPDAFFVYSAPTDALPVNALPMQKNGYITIASFNNFTKVTEATIALWKKILDAIPTARLLLSRVPIDARERFSEFEANRIEFVLNETSAEYFACHHRVDISLDTFPWTGHTTTCHSLWMGVPTITLAGPSSISRASASVLSHLQMADWIANSPEEYVDLAIRWSRQTNSLSELRQSLRERMQSSVLMDADRFTRNLETAYEQMWADFLSKK